MTMGSPLPRKHLIINTLLKIFALAFLAGMLISNYKEGVGSAIGGGAAVALLILGYMSLSKDAKDHAMKELSKAASSGAGCIGKTVGITMLITLAVGVVVGILWGFVALIKFFWNHS